LFLEESEKDRERRVTETREERGRELRDWDRSGERGGEWKAKSKRRGDFSLPPHTNDPGY